MNWVSLWALWLIVPLVFVAAYLFYNRFNKSTVKISSFKLFENKSTSLRERLYFLPEALKIAAAFFLIIAMARPQTSDTKVKKNVDGIDIIIAMDISDSMLIEDMKPTNRIEAAKDTLRRFVKARTSDRIGIVIFAGESFTLVPLTLDYDLILSRVDEITTAQDAHIKDGTAIGVGLANAAGKLRDSTAKSKVIIFMTDGENNCGTIDPDTGLEIAKGYGLKVYTIGIGQDGIAKIPVYQKDVFGNKVKTYQPFDSSINIELLQRMAKETGGKYYRANKEDSLQTIFKDIDQMEKTKIDVNKYTRYNEHFQIFVFIATILYLLAWILQRTWLRRYP